ncbi:amylo-alpha-1,6-glucosidase [Desulfatibacillum aliphaticivorans]|uniref:amylo-alpha-1,6-glucosidase n=1 Tax=Desulfatibacillum aliphaticivorans TaxID=218208 RepID=UPI0004175B7B|nr:amylo-alpha-1,6-glucosidase [Desulfatibacillum aliphaticivorans]
MENQINQRPEPGKTLLLFAGDTVTFTLQAPSRLQGAAWLRTNLDQAPVTRREIIRETELGEHPLGHDWFDIPMAPLGGGRFTLTLPVCDPGHFQCKCYFLEEGASLPLWPEGDNTVLNVEPADLCCHNTLYNAFVRQFGPNKAGKGRLPASRQELLQDLDKIGFSVIPPSGKFRDLIKELDFIIDVLGCRTIQLLPIHPTPTTYAKMGRFGSPYAALSFRGVDPALAEFDPKATPMEQFKELVDAIHARSAKIFLDIAINHTGWAARLHETHPEWLARTEDGEIERPGAWGVVWGDLTKLDYSHKSLWKFMAGVFLKWCRRGVDGFRCDAGYMVPAEAWKYILAKVREQFPDAVFLLEGLGGHLWQTRAILDGSNFDMAYSELFQNYERSQIEHYLPGAIELSDSVGIMLNFAETHDNARLAATSHTFAKMRTALCALFAPNGAFAFANGVEWLAAEKIDVHKACSLNWGSPVNQVEAIQRLSNILKNHPSFGSGVWLAMIQQGDGEFLVLLRLHKTTGKRILVLVNLDCDNPVQAFWSSHNAGMDGMDYTDLLTGIEVQTSIENGLQAVSLNPGQVMCLTPDREDLKLVSGNGEPESQFIVRQRLRAKALSVLRCFKGTGHLGEINPDLLAKSLEKDPEAFVAEFKRQDEAPGVIPWHWPRDKKREVMIPPGHYLIVYAKHPFSARVVRGARVLACERSFRMQGKVDSNGEKFFCLFTPFEQPNNLKSLKIHMEVYENGACERSENPLLLLPSPDGPAISNIYKGKEILDNAPMLLGTNGRGGMMRAHAAWGELKSRYDALLAANLDPSVPVDRWIMLTRCRAWVVYQGHSRELNSTCLDAFRTDMDSRGFWKFSAPCGQGQHVVLTFGLEMIPDKNAAAMHVRRHVASGQKDRLPKDRAISLILRPDVEDRSFHDVTKAYAGPEDNFPGTVKPFDRGFNFQPHPQRKLTLSADKGRFFHEPEWHYMVHRDLEAQRGLDPDSDLFSPGYFSIDLKGGDSVRIICAVNEDAKAIRPSENTTNLMSAPSLFQEEAQSAGEQAHQAMTHYVVKRDQEKTVIAGYPWFLDWGRDSLIFLRGLIAAGRLEESGAILKQFAAFEDRGTIPNMIRGADAGNRDTSDAPLWFFTACRDYVEAGGGMDFLDQDCGGRSLWQVMESLMENIRLGAPNGVRLDPESGLVYSPSHFTWMDTNYPPGSPRQGYPVEIQALWYAALDFAALVDERYKDAAIQTSQSLAKYFFRPDLDFLADCLHCNQGDAAKIAHADDALRPNQLFAVTLGAVRDLTISRSIVRACRELIVPGAIRSLADRPVQTPLPVTDNGKALNDPLRPYFGTYEGDEDTRRKPAYHNGTAWTWVFPSFCEAYAKVWPEAKDTALAWLMSSARLFRQGVHGHLPEVMDGDYPHTNRGCDAQAWGASEFYRVFKKLAPEKE